MKLMPFATALTVAAALLCMGCPIPLGTGNFTVHNRCQTLEEIPIPGSSSGLELRDAPIHERVLDLSSNFPEDFTNPDSRSTYEVRIVSVEIFSTTMGMDDFSFVDGLSILIAPAEGRADLPEMVAATYIEDPFAAALPALGLIPNPSFDPTPYLRNGAINVKILFSGVIPAQPFTIDARFCFSYREAGDIGI